MLEKFKGSKSDQILKVMGESETILQKYLDGLDVLIDMTKGSMKSGDYDIKSQLKDLDANGVHIKKIFADYKKQVEKTLGYKIK